MSSRTLSHAWSFLRPCAVGLVIFALLSSLPLARNRTAAQRGGPILSPESVFSNTAPITINSASAAVTAPVPWTAYPSTTTVSGMSGTITKLTVSLYGLNITRDSSLDVLLVGPTGANIIPLSDAGVTSSRDLFMTFDDAGATIPTSSVLTQGTFKPYNLGTGDVFASPAPAGPYNNPAPAGSSTLASVFNGTDPNGDWKLYLVDDEVLTPQGGAGSISNGWALNITTSGTAATRFANAAALSYTDTVVPASPYPSSINVSGMTGVLSSLKVTFNDFSHGRPSDVQVLLVSPNGKAMIILGGAGGSTPAANATFTLDDSAATSITTITNGTFRPTISTSGSFVYPAPPQPYTGTANLNNSFSGYSPNGPWSLYVEDNVSGQTGTIAGGWSLDITTVPYVPPAFGCANASFTGAAFTATGAGPTGIATADFNGDSKPDLATANQSSNDVSILLNNGSGGFGSATSFSAGTNPYSLATGDFNNDTKTDLVVVNSGSGNLSILLGNGMGSFGAPANLSAGQNPIWAAVKDLNGDGKEDLAVANFGGFFAGTVSILLGNGMGGFGPPAAFNARTQPSYVAIADFNADTKPDLAVANFGSNNVSILLGSGTGSFAFSNNVAVGTGPVSIAVGDYNTDGKLDLAVANYNSNSYTVRTGIGDGTFNNGGNSATGTSPISITAGDFDNNGSPDLAIANSGSSIVTLSVSGTATLGSAPNAIVSADFDADGRADLAAADTGSNDVAVLLNRCLVAHGNLFDLDGGRKTDLGVYRPSSGFWYAVTSFGGTLATQFAYGHPTDRPVPADYDGNGITDFAFYRSVSGAWSVGGTNRIYNLQFGLPTDIPVPADYDGDRRADIAVFRPSDGNWYIRQSTDNAMVTANFGVSGDLPVPSDFDGDGKADLVVFRPSTGIWYLMNSGGGVLGVAFGSNGDRPVSDDYDGDGKSDIAVYRNGTWYYLQSSDGAFKAYTFGIAGDIPIPGDYDSDGKFDIAVYRPSTGFWYAILSSNGTVANQQFGTTEDIPLPSTDIP